ncbi:MAG: RsmE family RNA methyltransferase [Acidimicrobiales bacterium]
MGAPVLGPDDQHHLERVLRLRAGDAVSVADGRGRWRLCALGDRGHLDPTGEVRDVPATTPLITIAFAVTKGERPELAVQKLTELGVDRITVFHAHRSVARWEGERAARHLERLRRVSREAAVQSRRAWLPTVTELTDVATLLSSPGSALADPSGAPPSLAHPTVVVGPEGGFTAEERAVAHSMVRLGPLVLRAETAAMAAGTLLSGMRDGVVAPVDRPR